MADFQRFWEDWPVIIIWVRVLQYFQRKAYQVLSNIICTSARLPAGSMRSSDRICEAVIGRNQSVRSISSRGMR